MANSHEREEFSKRLKQALREAGVGVPGAVRLAQEFKAYSGSVVTHQAAQKWLNGESIPTQDKVRALAEWLQKSPDWLRFGTGKEVGAAGAADAASVRYRHALSDQELVKRYRKLSDRQQQAVAEVITALAAKDLRR
ncbi:MAG: helix-turn-helix domain-containing protein [Nitrosomonadales bacterium]